MVTPHKSNDVNIAGGNACMLLGCAMLRLECKMNALPPFPCVFIG
jgi:hypothetical protein